MWHRTVDDHDYRAKVLNHHKVDIVCLVEMWFRGDEVVAFEGYQWLGHNRSNSSSRAVRGSGGVGMLIRSCWC